MGILQGGFSMAQFNQNAGGLVFKPEPPPPPPKKAKKKPAYVHTCDGCGMEVQGRGKQSVTVQQTGMCKGCGMFFGLSFLNGVTNMAPWSVKERLKEVEESKHVIILKSGNFRCEQTGDSLGVDFGDIFPINRVGTVGKPDGSNDYAMAAFTIDVLVNNRALKLFPHEFASIPWVSIMLYKKEGDYCEAFLSAQDKQGYFAPSEEVKAEIVNAYGDR
jgi:hypothetical protein